MPGCHMEHRQAGQGAGREIEAPVPEETCHLSTGDSGPVLGLSHSSFSHHLTLGAGVEALTDADFGRGLSSRFACFLCYAYMHHILRACFPEEKENLWFLET